MSISYGVDEIQQGTEFMQAENSELTQLAAQGITVLASSGDLGAYGNTGSHQLPATLNVNDPSSQPLVTSVGGTSLTTGPQQSYVGETVWNDLASSEGATGEELVFFGSFRYGNKNMPLPVTTADPRHTGTYRTFLPLPIHRPGSRSTQKSTGVGSK